MPKWHIESVGSRMRPKWHVFPSHCGSFHASHQNNRSVFVRIHNHSCCSTSFCGIRDFPCNDQPFTTTTQKYGRNLQSPPTIVTSFQALPEDVDLLDEATLRKYQTENSCRHQRQGRPAQPRSLTPRNFLCLQRPHKAFGIQFSELKKYLMKVKALSRSKASTQRECVGDLRKQSRNLDPVYHPMQRPREMARALTAAKMERMVRYCFRKIIHIHSSCSRYSLSHRSLTNYVPTT